MKIQGMLYLLDSDGGIVYYRKYYSKKNRDKILESLIKHYGLANRSFTIQIAPNEN